MVSKHFEDIKIKFVEDTDLTAKIVAEPFERGYAVTVGNALRRALMTSVPGAAIVSIKIDGVQHEFKQKNRNTRSNFCNKSKSPNLHD